MLVHSTAFGAPALGAYGPEAAEHTPGATPDADVDRADMVRQASLYDSRFAARNVSASTTPNSAYSLQTYSANRYNKIFFVNNEPDSFYPASALPSQSNIIDGYTGINGNSFWDPVNPDPNTQRRITPTALALAFLRLKRDFGNSRGHIVLPPCPTGAIAGGLNPPTDTYWQQFFDTIHPLAPALPGPITVGGQSENQIVPSSLTALHLHYYSPPRQYPVPSGTGPGNNKPMEAVAEGAYYLRKSVKWYRDRYVGASQSLPMDVLLSEFGHLWSIIDQTSPNYVKVKWLWGGGWDNFRDGLSWWNTWLCWLLRRAPIEFNLAGSPNGNLTDSRAVYACAHETHQAPYMNYTTPNGTYYQIQQNTRNQFFFHCGTNSVGIVNNAEFINVTQMVQEGRFLPSFSCFPTTLWNDGYGYIQNFNFRLAPFGACYKVWAEVGADALTGNLATGWVNTTQANEGGTVSIVLPSGYSTVYIPIIKSQNGGVYAAGTRFDVKWGPQEILFGYGEMSEFPNSNTHSTIYETNNGVFGPRSISDQPQTVYSTMVFPIVCFSPSGQTINIKVVRNIGGAAFAIGRPVVIPRVCSWLTNQ
jgi:hypothetical protein